MRMKCLTVSSALALVASAHASFTVIKGIDNWNAAVGPCTTLDFVFPTPQIMGDQYASLGAIFPEGNEVAFQGSPNLYQQDGWGCKAYDDAIDITFLWPQYAIGAWFPGELAVKLYWQGELIYDSRNWGRFRTTTSLAALSRPSRSIGCWSGIPSAASSSTTSCSSRRLASWGCSRSRARPRGDGAAMRDRAFDRRRARAGRRRVCPLVRPRAGGVGG